MSSGSHHKMYDYEVAPPPGIWEKIEAELDESELSQKFPSLLYHFETPPPANTWQKIALALDEPVLVQDYATRLSGIEVAPPAAAWDKIKTSLDETTRVRRIPPFIKYAAAAALAGLLVWGGIRFLGDGKNNMGSSTANIPAAEHTTTPANEPISIDDSELAVSDINAAMEEARNDAALEESKKTYAKLDAGTKRTRLKNAADFFFVTDDDYTPTVSTRGLPQLSEEEPPPPPVDITNRYIVLMTPDGNIIRMSKKLRNLVCCVSGEEVDKDCVDQMKKWREKIASPAATHTPGNFLDLLHMLNSLQDK